MKTNVQDQAMWSMLLAVVLSNGAEAAGRQEFVSAPPALPDGLSLDQWRERIKAIDPADPGSAEFVPGLRSLAGNPRVPGITRRQAALTLGRIGSPAASAVPQLADLVARPGTEASNPDEPSVRAWAAKALALFGPTARDAAPMLAEAARDATLPLEDRLAAMEALARIGTAHPAAPTTLVALLGERAANGDRDAVVRADEIRQAAAEAFGLIGPGADIAVPALIRALSDEAEPVRRYAATALGRVGPRADPAVPALVEALGFDESPAVRDEAALALARIGAAAWPVLIRLLEDRDPTLRRRAADALGRTQPPARAAVVPLTARLRDDDPTVRLAAIEALWAIAGRIEPLVVPCLESLADQDREVRMQVARWVLKLPIETAGPALRPGLERLAVDDRPAVRTAARRLLDHFDRKPAAVP